ncbi:MAG: tRNA (adenosine(37)-N6)-threonylcarbamoyltransferase complex ATPase subunit type 1 TsaE [Xanthomonadales bacterium]|nr:tRNA (adenosine(37)-N6)-threonylcarbamoyltransferase complex ATPase subunit type 1 TsaE [Xanthomonadales bacterium]
MSLALPDAGATRALGARLAPLLAGGGLVTLRGDLGAGKTSLARAVLQSLGHPGAVRSPTYALAEPYTIGELQAWHLDLYRIADPGELEFLGLREWLRPGVLVLVEWPERAAGWLPPADLDVVLEHDGEGRRVRLSGPLAATLSSTPV